MASTRVRRSDAKACLEKDDASGLLVLVEGFSTTWVEMHLSEWWSTTFSWHVCPPKASGLLTEPNGCKLRPLVVR
eukprot:204271-Amphidinium_carterae.1